MIFSYFRKYISLLSLAIFYVAIAYFLERTDFLFLIISFGLLFFFTFKLIQSKEFSFKNLAIISIVLRLIFLFSLPNLSQDFYRFIWDGRLIVEGLNPYIHLPNDLISDPDFKLSQANYLVQKMGNLSASHYSNYPPINQLFFTIAGFFGKNSIIGSVIILRVIIILADLGTLYFGAKLLTNLGLNKNRIFWYILNPLVIIELTGNLHFEGVMLFFFVWSMYLLHQKKWKFAAVILALSISTKLLPLLLLPLFFQKLAWKKSIAFYGIILGINLLFFAPFFSQTLIENYSKTIGLWFTNFEFNASFYYILREIGFYFTGYNIIQTTGKIIPILMVLYILYRTFFTKNKTTLDLLQSILVVLTIYFLTSTTVHPWYIINLVLLGIFTKYKFPIIWSLTAILSYSAYATAIFKENYWLIFLEYSVVLIYILWEISPLLRRKINAIFAVRN
ncbi:polyprenol phosphomannose-dependent alpha 1,6 mannosyltransferase MptB [Frigoriflavimonas asaccharolytica]|uniref:Mannosyltransferase n=1 Tax=Frigoriflavimonas asaccharolytica TaxID=2735899 RepID=A0A8J8K5Q4_9FLAO|nr:polyprenol phosphomannose-dependent alpha 1,6 mannosyltransferase MptB [Frigoriflavimonas asaccharolytica]NRS92940.1 hypothetical protein [Frigoriflavimonas asaccharolytica]